MQISRSLAGVCVLLGTLICLASTTAHANAPVPPRKDGPVDVEVSITLNRIYDINTVNETYVIDGYLLLAWSDPRLAAPSGDKDTPPNIYENTGIDGVLGTEIWWPNIEFINVAGDRSTPSRRLVVNPDGKVAYHERFYATFSTEMDFRKYPFDRQVFAIHIKSFSHDAESVIFTHREDAAARLQSDSWHFETPTISSETVAYPDINTMLRLTGSSGSYSRLAVSVSAERETGYFIWQFFLPLFLIIGTSWSVFWFSDISDRLSTAFTLMLTVVAFNFYVTSLLPQLPYNTLIEAVIISGYLEITVAIIFIVIGSVWVRKGQTDLAERATVILRWFMPASYMVSLLILIAYFL